MEQVLVSSGVIPDIPLSDWDLASGLAHISSDLQRGGSTKQSGQGRTYSRGAASKETVLLW